MKRIPLNKIAATLLTLTLAGSAVAIPIVQPHSSLNFQDIDPFGVTLNAEQSANGTFDIVNGALGSTTIGSGYANAGNVYTDLGGYVLGSPILSATDCFYNLNCYQGNDVLSIALSNTFLFGVYSGVTSSNIEGSASIALLQSNGSLCYSVAQSGSTGGSSFIFDYA